MCSRFLNRASVSSANCSQFLADHTQWLKSKFVAGGSGLETIGVNPKGDGEDIQRCGRGADYRIWGSVGRKKGAFYLSQNPSGERKIQSVY